MCELAVCQTVSGVTATGADGQRPTAAPSAATGRPLSPSRPSSAANRPRPARGGRAGRGSRRRETPPGPPSAPAAPRSGRGRASLCAEVERRNRRPRLEHPRDAVVGVLIDDHEPERTMALPPQRVEERRQLGGSIDRGDDEVDAEVGSRSRHRRRLPSARRGASARVRRPRRPRRGGNRRGSRRERSRADRAEPRADPRRRRVEGSHGRDRHGDRRPSLRVLSQRGAARARRALNVGLDAAGGTYVARMDADDLALPHWLEAVLGRIRSTPRRQSSAPG